MASQLVEHFHLKHVWARDTWHLTSRVLRKVLSHTIAVCLCLEQGCHPSPSLACSPSMTTYLHIALLATREGRL